jgi:peroxiredoxin
MDKKIHTMKKILVVLILSFGLNQMAFAQETEKKGYQIGDIATDFNLKGVDGKMHSLASLTGSKGYLVIFTCNHCPYSQAYGQRIIELHKKYAAKGIQVIAINPNDPNREPNDSYDNMVKRAKKYKYRFNYLLDETQIVAKAYGATRTPHVFLLDQNRQVVYMGAIDDNFEEPTQVKETYLENALNQLLAGLKIELPQTKAIGCSIKWKKS